MILADIEDADFIRSLGTRNLDGAIIGVAENLEAGIMATLLCKEIGIPMVVDDDSVLHFVLDKINLVD